MIYLKIKHLSKTQENADIFSKNDMLQHVKQRARQKIWTYIQHVYIYIYV